MFLILNHFMRIHLCVCVCVLTILSNRLCPFFITDGDENEKNIRGWLVRSHNFRGRQELLRAIRTGK